MDFFYFLVTGSEIYSETDTLSALKDYFTVDGGFATAFWTALAIAGGFAVLYYIFCRCSFAWARLGTWVATLIVAGAASFFATAYETGSFDNDGKLISYVQNVYDEAKEDASAEEQEDLTATEDEVVTAIDRNVFASSPVNRLCWTNLVLTLIFFYIFSIIINGASGAGSNIPHRGLFTHQSR